MEAKEVCEKCTHYSECAVCENLEYLERKIKLACQRLKIAVETFRELATDTDTEAASSDFVKGLETGGRNVAEVALNVLETALEDLSTEKEKTAQRERPEENHLTRL